MVQRALKTCAAPSCPNLTDKRVCAKHSHERSQADQAMRGTATQRGYGARHRRWREVVLARDPICKDPDRRHRGVVVASLVADHVVPLSQGGTWELSNGQGLCLSCHNHKTATEQRAVRAPSLDEGGGGLSSLGVTSWEPREGPDSLLYGLGTVRDPVSGARRAGFGSH